MKKIGILGSTGSIGKQALEIIQNSNLFKVCYLSAYSNINLLIEQTIQFKPKSICIIDKSKVLFLNQNWII